MTATPCMVLMHAHLNAAFKVRRLRISLPLIECLIDNERYFMPEDEPALRGEDYRPFTRPRMRGRPRSHDERRLIEKRAARRREQRDYDELARLLGDPI